MDRRTFLRSAIFAALGAGAVGLGLPTFAAAGKLSQAAVLTWQGTSITVGPDTGSLRTMTAAYCDQEHPGKFTSQHWARSGTNSWNALARVRRVAESNPAFVQIDWRNDRVNVPFLWLTREAWIRRTRILNPYANIVMTVWPWVEDGKIGDLPDESLAYIELCEHYSVPVLDVHTAIGKLIAAGHDLTEYYNWPYDGTHPLTTGHLVAWEMLKEQIDDILFGERQYDGNLPGCMTNCQEYERGTEMYSDGTDYLSRSGDWAQAAPGIYSNQPGATVAYHFTGCSVGVESSYAEFYPPQYVDYRIDGGAWQANQPMSGNGLRVANYGPHTIEMRVRTELAIDHFLSI